ncbi:MAG: cell division protein ZipA [Xanthomonadales bacterium]|nr:cell division protein ZipA [Xanthomonadales bacterium]
MDTATLRWIIIAIGIIILGTIFLFGNPEKKQKPRASRRKPTTDGAGRLEPTLDESEIEHEAETAELLELQGQGELPMDKPPGRIEPELKAVPEPRKPPKSQKPAGPPPEKIVTLFILATDKQVINGTDLLQVALKTGLELGDMDIFHRQADGSDTPVFSLANAHKPGYFDKDAWNSFETKALVVFLTLPGPMLALDAWDTMLASVKRIASVLNAELHDEEHQPLTRQKEGKIREEMRHFDRERARKALL